MSTTRRDFLKSGAAAGAAVPLANAKAAPSWLRSAAGGADDPILVVLQVSGGYDLFQSLIPATHSVYQNARPTIGIAAGQTLGEIDNGSGLYWHPALAAFKTMYDAGKVAVIQNVGYPQPNLSHFESEKIWYGGDRNISSSGWIGRYLELGYQGTAQMPALDIDRRVSPSFAPARVPVLLNSDSFGFVFDRNTAGDNQIEELAIRLNAQWLRPTPHPNLTFLGAATVGAMDDSQVLQSVGSNYQPRVTYPNGGLANAFKLAARYVTGGLESHVYYLRTGGFDNHANLAVPGNTTTGTFATRIRDVADNVKAFLDDINAHNVQRPLLIMLWSEFSRRLGENTSSGTDHGHGGVAYLIGDSVNGGRYGNYPDLNQARQPYNRWFVPFDALSTDFRSLYATVLDRWLQVDHVPILGARFPLLGAL